MEKEIDGQLKRELPFDLYGRYAVIRDIIDHNRKDGQKFKVLDVGGRGNLLKRFLSNDDVFYLDPLIDSKDDNFIKGDGCAMPLKDNEFDWVTSADVFEHIPKEKRKAFLDENIRVARLGTILVAPFWTKEVEQAEINANENYKILSGGKDHMWLREHIENGLPDMVEVEKSLKEKKLLFQKLYNNRLFLWQSLVDICFLVSLNNRDDIPKAVDDFNYFYNTEIYPFDNQEPSYRKIYFIKKDSSLCNIKAGDTAIDDGLFLGAIKKGFELVNMIDDNNRSIIVQKDLEIQSKNQAIKSMEHDMESMAHESDLKSMELSEIHRSKGWRAVIFTRNIINKFLPKGSLRRKAVVIFFKYCEKNILAVKNIWHHWLYLASKTCWYVRHEGITQTFIRTRDYILFRRGFFHKPIQKIVFSGRHNAWVKYRQTFSRKVRPLIINRIKKMSSQPLVSIIVPTYNTPETMLREMLQSVKGQLYPNWELCIADDGSNQPNVKKILKEYAAKDRRIKLHFGLKNKGVSSASNRALSMTTGEFVILLDHDDILEEQALFRVAESILEDNPDMIYSDEVLVTSDLAKVIRYAYRPAFSPEFLRAHPYIVHLVGFRTKLLRDIGGFDEDLSISQDYDLILRASEKAQTVVHIPEILYQWRLHGDSTGERKMHEVMETSKSILRRHLARCGEAGNVNNGAGFNLFDARYKLNEDLRVAIIIPTKNHGDILRQCVDSIHATVSGVRYDIIVIDHESDDSDTLAYLSSISPGVRVLPYKGSFNFSTINNWAVSLLGDKYSHYLFCNNDIEAIGPGWLERMMELGQHPSIGIVGAKLLYPDRKTIQHAGVCIGAFGCAEHYGKFLDLSKNPGEAGFLEIVTSTHEVAAVTAACLLIRREVFEQVAGFDEALAVGFGDVDLCLRVGECGYRVLYCPYAELVHHESYTRGKSKVDPHPADSALFLSKWQKLLQAGDFYFNPGLSLMSTSWQTKYPLNYILDIKRRIFKRNEVSGKQIMTHSSVV